ncbi:neuronal-specific septin-3-like isoform X5 [Bolinopsis microptera]|uniref:neuronal-specific septin-3-like isoform X5 n=1 Tax=Bolinopsis microptera TaxID=2820187 RepID=UPI00307AA5E1
MDSNKPMAETVAPVLEEDPIKKSGLDTVEGTAPKATVETKLSAEAPPKKQRRAKLKAKDSSDKAATQLLTESQLTALENAFKVGDVEDRGVVDAGQVQYIVQQVLGDVLTVSEVRTLVQKAEAVGAATGVLNLQEFKDLLIDLLHTTTTRWGEMQTTLDGYVGFDTVLEQQRKKFLKKGFEFNLMVVGESGLGKSTLVNTLFKSKVSRTSCTNEPPQKIPKTVEINTVTHVIEEKNVRLRLSITDTPGFGDQVNNENCWLPIYDQINKQFDKFLTEERSVVRRKQIPDSRIHCCLYFIAPTGHGLKALDISCMKKLHDVVNIIPVIAKADTMTIEERDAFKERIREDIAEAEIKVYPSSLLPEDEDVLQANAPIRKHLPLAVVGSDRALTINNKSILGRQTKWGFVEVENPNHCEFSFLRDMLLRTHMQDLKDTTHEEHYENYRRQKLSEEVGENNGAGA